MKKITTFLFGLLVSAVSFAQDTPKIQPNPNHRPMEDPRPKLPTGVKTGTPDIVMLSVKVGPIEKVQTNNQTINMRTVSYTLKNAGTASVDLSKITLQGFVGYDDVMIPSQMTPVCGAVAKQNGGFLVAGGTFSGSYKCTIDSKWSGMHYYLIIADNDNSIQELNEKNNQARTHFN